MRMPEEQVADVRVGPHDLGKGLLLGKTDVIDTGKVQIKGRVMHEQVDRFVLMLCQGGLQPLAPLLTINAAMGIVLDGVDDDKNARRGLHRVLHETVVVDFCLCETTSVILTMIVITDNEMTLHIQPGNLFGQQPISRIFTSISEISGDDTALGVAMMEADVIDTAGKAFGRIKAVQLRARGNQVGIGDVYEFHSLIVFGRIELWWQLRMIPT